MSPSDFALPNIGDFALPDISSLAELLPHQKASDPVPDPAVAALKDIQSAQQQHVAALQENNFLLQQNSALLQQDSIALASLRQSVVDEQAGVKKISAQIADEHQDVKKISAKISALMAKVNSLKNAMNSGSNFLHFSKARAKPAIPSSAQKDGSAAEPCGTYFAWRSPPKSPGDHASPARLKNKEREAWGFGPACGGVHVRGPLLIVLGCSSAGNSPPSLFELRRDSLRPARRTYVAPLPRRLACRAEARRAKAGRRRQIRTADPLGVNEML